MSLLGSITSSVLGSLFRRWENFHLSGREREQNAYNAEQAELQRSFASQERIASQEFNAEQAQQQMAFQERMASTQYQRSVADMQAAGVNPAVAMTGGIAGASASGAMAQSSPASGAAASGSTQLQGLSDLLEFAKMKKEIDLLDAQEGSIRKDTEYKQKQINVFDKMTDAEYENLMSDLQTKAVKRELDRMNISETEARTAVEIQQATMAMIDNKYRDELNKLEVDLKAATIANVKQSTAESAKRIEELDAQINELYQRAILEACEAGNIDQQTENLLIEHDILSVDREKKQYEVKYKGLNFWTGQIGNVFGAVSSAASAYGMFGVGTRALGLGLKSVSRIGF